MSDSNNAVPSVHGARCLFNDSGVPVDKGLDSVYQNASIIESELVARKLTPTCCMQTTMDMFVAVQNVE